MELCLDLSLSSVSRTISELLGQSQNGFQKISKLENFIKRLEDEKKKIEAFKRELPLSMILINDAIARLKEEIRCIRMQDEPVVQELMPLKTNLGGKESLTLGMENSDKKNWMSSVQLWSTTETKSRSEEDDRSVPSNPIQQRKDEKEVSKVPNLSLMTPTFELKQRNSTSGCDASYGSSSVTRTVEINSSPQPQQNSKKQRRCWSPELHRRFVDALQRLGGPQVATPKQIRELMQVGGLTNDEVKSHLQKYRLHCKKLPLSSVGKCNSVLWLEQNQSEDYKSKGNSSQSGSPQGPLFLRGSVKGLSSSGRNSLDSEEDVQSDCHNQITRS